MKKLCIVFPGRRYSVDRSLLYFPSSIIKNLGYEMIYLHYDTYKENEDTNTVEKDTVNAYGYTLNRIKDINFDNYEKVIFLSKSIGTVVASKIKDSYKLKDAHQILITPLDETIPHITNDDLIICGDKDSFLSDAKTKLAPYPNTYIFPGFTHSLESKENYKLTIKTIADITTIVDIYLRSIDA